MGLRGERIRKRGQCETLDNKGGKMKWERKKTGFVLTIVEIAEPLSSELPDEECHDTNDGDASGNTQPDDRACAQT